MKLLVVFDFSSVLRSPWLPAAAINNQHFKARRKRHTSVQSSETAIANNAAWINRRVERSAIHSRGSAADTGA